MRNRELAIVLLSSPTDCVDNDRTEQSLGLAYIASTLKAHNYAVQIVELTGYHSAELLTALRTIPIADVYGLSCYSTNYQSVKQIVTHLRTIKPDAYICLGGPHPTALPLETLQDLPIDSVVVGDGELAFLNIVNALKQGNRINGIVTAITPVHLDELPFPNRHLVDQNTFSRTLNRHRTLSLITSRGCRYQCLHCNSVVMGGSRLSVKFRSTANVLAEIRELKQMGYHALRFSDDNFADNPDIAHLVSAIAEENISYRIFSRLEHLTPSTVALLAASGCKLISVGIESLNPKNLRFLRKASVLRCLANLENTHRYGIPVRASFMVGLPYDTDASIERYFAEAYNLPFSEYAIYALLPYPGTPLWEQPARYGYEIIDRDFTRYVQMGIGRKTAFVLKHTDPETGYTFLPADMERWHSMANAIFSTKRHMSESPIG